MHASELKFVTSCTTSLHRQARGEVPRLPNGFPEKSSRLDRPRARDRPKPRRRPRPKDGGEMTTTRRSRSAPAQSSPAVAPPPTHTTHHEGFLFRKLDIESLKKSTNRWVFRVLMAIQVLDHRVKECLRGRTLVSSRLKKSENENLSSLLSNQWKHQSKYIFIYLFVSCCVISCDITAPSIN